MSGTKGTVNTQEQKQRAGPRPHPEEEATQIPTAGKNPVFNNLLEAIGNTPLIRIDGFHKNKEAIIYGKFECFNPTGSVKDKTALKLVEHAEQAGVLKQGGTVVESTSGNLGVALAMVCAVKGYRFIAVVDPKIPTLNLNVMKAYGAQIEMVDTPDANGGYQKPRIQRVKDLVASVKGGVNLDQYNNGQARQAHFHTTGPEIYNALREVDVLVGAVSTGGHLCGTAEYLKKMNPSILVVGVEPEGSAIFRGEYKPYKQNGTGLSFRPGNYKPEYVDLELKVSDRDAFARARQMAKKGMLVGGSSGGVLHVAIEYAEAAKKELNVVAIFPDEGFKYFDTVYSDEWLREHKLA